MVWGLGTVLGPVVGGAFELYTWRWAFYINLLFGAILLPAYLFLIPSSNSNPSSSIMQRARGLDYVGALLSVTGFVTLIMAINFGGTLYAWNSGSVIALFVVSGVLWIVFTVQQAWSIFTSPAARMFPAQLLRYREAVMLFVIGCCVGTISYVDVYYIPLYFQFTRGDTAIKTAERILPFILFLIVLMLASGFLMSRIGYYKPWYVGGSLLALIGAVLMCMSFPTLNKSRLFEAYNIGIARVDVTTDVSQSYGYQVLLGFGAGAYTQAGFAVIQAVVPAKDAADGVTLMLIGKDCLPEITKLMRTDF